MLETIYKIRRHTNLATKLNTLKYCVYAHTNKINGKKYIGITSQKPEARWGINGSRYLYEDSRAKSAFAIAIRKYGWENFSHEILFNGLTENEAKHKECELIKKYRTADKEVKITIQKILEYTKK